MTIDEAIKHLEEVLEDENREWSCKECREEHIQLLEFLRELEDSRKLIAMLKKGITTFDFLQKVNSACSECLRNSGEESK